MIPAADSCTRYGSDGAEPVRSERHEPASQPERLPEHPRPCCDSVSQPEWSVQDVPAALMSNCPRRPNNERV